MKNYLLPIFILIMSVVYIFFIPESPMLIKILFKLIPMWLIICYTFIRSSSKVSKTYWVIICGLFFCMLGDGLLHWFVIGLTAFLIGHLFYMGAFFSKWHFSWIRFASIIPIAIYSFFIGNKIITAILQSGNGSLILPVIIYICVISCMLWSAIMTGNIGASIGSVLFVTSDSILSWNMFVSSIPYSSVFIMTTYYLAQFLIAYSARFVVTEPLYLDKNIGRIV